MIRANFNAYGSYVTDSLYQWDINQDLAINGLNLTEAPEIHFTNVDMVRAIVRQSTLENGVVTVRIPNSLLRSPLTIKAYVGVYEGDTFKVIETVEIPIIAKTKPADYTIEDSDEEIYSFKALENEIVNAKKEIADRCDANLVELTAAVEQAKTDFEAEVDNTTNTLSAQVANIIAHNNDTSGNTELIDIRTGVDGTVYTSAGDAVRGQVRQVREVDDNSVRLDKTWSSAKLAEKLDEGKITTGEIVTITPKSNSTTAIISKISGMDEGFSFANILRLTQIKGKNLVDFTTMMGGAGKVYEANGQKAVINGDGTITFTGTNTSSDWNELVYIQLNDTNRILYPLFPAGTYTLSPGLTINICCADSKWSNLGNKHSTFTVDRPFWIDRAYYAFASGATADYTRPMAMVFGSQLPSEDIAYNGTVHIAQFSRKIADGEFNWLTGELKDSEGNLIERIAPFEPFSVFEGENTFFTGAGESTISYSVEKNDGAVHFDKIQELTDEQKSRARSNIGASAISIDAEKSGCFLIAGENGNLDYLDKKEIQKQFEPERWGLPVLYLNGDITQMTKDNAVDLAYTYGESSGVCSVKWQGSSSLSYSKKNYTINFDTPFEASDGWGSQKKYCAKANYIDFSHSRNIVNAKLWGQIVKSRPNIDTRLSNLVNGGAVDGFPIIIMINGDFQGLYTFNIPKDGWLYGMGSGNQEAILCAGNANQATKFRTEAVVDSDFDLEYVTDKYDTAWVTTSFNRLINACINSDGTDLDTTVAQYLDWESAIDYYIFTVLVGGHDMTYKNYLLSTYDGTKWFFGAYDMDCTYGLHWDGSYWRPITDSPTFSTFTGHRVMELIYLYKKDALKARYAELRKSVLSESNIATMFTNFAGRIPISVYMQDANTWSTIPNTSTNNVGQIRDYYRIRAELADEWIEKL